MLADETRVLEVLDNLISNSIKFSDPGSTVTVGASFDKGEVRIWVRDHGRGIPPEDLPRVFDRFYCVDRARSRPGGSGLGLAIVSHVAAAHGGQATVESEPGKGSVFKIQFPREARPRTNGTVG